MSNISSKDDPGAGLEEQFIEYERTRRQKSSNQRLSPQQTYVLRQASRNGTVKERDLRRAKGFPAASLSRTVSELVRRGLIVRDIDTQDGRYRLLRPTNKTAGALARMDAVFAPNVKLSNVPPSSQVGDKRPEQREKNPAVSSVAVGATSKQRRGTRRRKSRPDRPPLTPGQQFLSFD